MVMNNIWKWVNVRSCPRSVHMISAYVFYLILVKLLLLVFEESQMQFFYLFFLLFWCYLFHCRCWWIHHHQGNMHRCVDQIHKFNSKITRFLVYYYLFIYFEFSFLCNSYFCLDIWTTHCWNGNILQSVNSFSTFHFVLLTAGSWDLMHLFPIRTCIIKADA